jgi:release factor glutamine methyltransferase
MTIAEYITDSQKKLANSSITTARLDCLVLLEDILSKDRSWILAHPETTLTTAHIKILEMQIERRAKHEPLAYIRGKSEFFGRMLSVNEHTLQPRPETETLVELALDIASNNKLTVNSFIDVGTGSGAIAITLKLELPDRNVFATDISTKCIQMAKNNANQLKADIQLVQTNLIMDVPTELISGAIVCCNLPYVPDSFTINQAAMFEPKLAIFGGEDGLDCYRQLFEQLEEKHTKPFAIITESLPTQHTELEKIALKHGFKLGKTQDFIQVFGSW